MRLSTVSQIGRCDAGNIAPDRKNSGSISICVSAMNDCICRMRAAIITPNVVMVNASSSWMPKTARISVGA